MRSITAGLPSTTSSVNYQIEDFHFLILGPSLSVLVNIEADWVVAFVIGNIIVKFDVFPLDAKIENCLLPN